MDRVSALTEGDEDFPVGGNGGGPCESGLRINTDARAYRSVAQLYTYYVGSERVRVCVCVREGDVMMIQEYRGIFADFLCNTILGGSPRSCYCLAGYVVSS